MYLLLDPFTKRTIDVIDNTIKKRNYRKKTSIECSWSPVLLNYHAFIQLWFDISVNLLLSNSTSLQKKLSPWTQQHSVTSGQKTKERNLRVCLVLFVLHNMVDLQWWVKYQMLQIPEISERIPCKQIFLLLIVIKTNQFFYSNSPSHSPFMIPFDS